MKKGLKYVLLILFISLAILFFYQLLVKAVETNEESEYIALEINSIEDLKTALGGKATIDGNTIKLTNNVTLKNKVLYIKIPNLVVELNGKTIECRERGHVFFETKSTLQDTLTTNRDKWGGFIFYDTGINVSNYGELIINSGKFVDGGTNDNSKVYVAGQLIINDAIFSTTRSKPAYKYNYMIDLGPTSECIINGGEFSHTDTILSVDGSKYTNKCKLTINGGNFNCENSDVIKIYTFYPYVNNNNKEVITPKITLNNCNMYAKHTVIGFWGGCTDEEFINTDTKILTILGGTYRSSEQTLGAPIEIRTYSDPNTYFNSKDFVFQGGTFESLKASEGAMRLLGPRKR